MQQEMFRQAVTMMQKQQSRLKARVDEGHRTAAATSKSGSSSAAALEATVAAEVRTPAEQACTHMRTHWHCVCRGS